jgi:hypothetical protein
VKLAHLAQLVGHVGRGLGVHMALLSSFRDSADATQATRIVSVPGHPQTEIWLETGR